MHNLDVVGPVIVSISAASGFVAGLLSMRHFHAETGVHRLFAFWPVFGVVSVVMFFACTLLHAWMFGSN
jgi:hypothetical protein